MDPRTEQLLKDRAQKAATTPPPPRGAMAALNSARQWATKNRNSTRILAGAAVAVFFAAYHLIVTLPAQRADQLELKARADESLKMDVTSRQSAVDACLSKAKADADAIWAAGCKKRREGATCALPEQQANTIERDERAARNACLMTK